MVRVYRVILIAILLMICCAPVASAALFIHNGPWAFTNHWGPNSAGFMEGHRLNVGVFMTDTLGVPSNITSAEAVALTPGQPDFTLPYLNVGPIFRGLYETATPYTGQHGQWEVTVTNLQGDTVTAPTNMLNAHLIPLATNLQVSGTGLAPTITWDPVVFDHDRDSVTPEVEVNNYRIRLLNGRYDQFFRSERIYGYSFTVPEGLIVPGATHIRLEANHEDNVNGFQNRSNTFVQYNAVPIPGAVLLLSSGLLGLTVIRKRFRQ